MTETQPEIVIDLKELKLNLRAEVTHKPGAVRLDGYPLLVYAPAQHGPGIRTEDNGTPVADIAVAAAETPDYNVLARKFKTTPEHVEQAIRYAYAAQQAAAPKGA